MYLCWSAYDRNRVLFIHRLLPRSSLHLLLFIHRRLPPASTCYCSSTASYSRLHQLLFISIHLLLFNHPSTRSCSSSPNWLGCVSASSGSCSSSRNGLYYHGVLFIHPPPGTVHQTPNNGHCSSRGRFDRLQLEAVAKESLGFS